MLNVDFYHKVNSQCPVKEYLDLLSPKLRTKTLRSVIRGVWNAPQDAIFSSDRQWYF